MDNHQLKRELFELSHAIFGVSTDAVDASWDEIHPRLIRCLGRLGDIIIAHHDWIGGGVHPLAEIEVMNNKTRIRHDKMSNKPDC